MKNKLLVFDTIHKIYNNIQRTFIEYKSTKRHQQIISKLRLKNQRAQPERCKQTTYIYVYIYNKTQSNSNERDTIIIKYQVCRYKEKSCFFIFGNTTLCPRIYRKRGRNFYNWLLFIIVLISANLTQGTRNFVNETRFVSTACRYSRSLYFSMKYVVIYHQACVFKLVVYCNCAKMVK